MDSDSSLLISGTLLLAVSALLGFVQERYRDSPELFARWRVVHAGGTAGAVQLLALAAVWDAMDQHRGRPYRAADLSPLAGASYRVMRAPHKGVPYD